MLATVTDPEGGTTRYAYDSNNRLTTITDLKGITFLQNFYGPSGRVLRQVQADGSEYRFRYHLTGVTTSGAGCTVINPSTGTPITTVTLPFVPCPTVESWENLQPATRSRAAHVVQFPLECLSVCDRVPRQFPFDCI